MADVPEAVWGERAAMPALVPSPEVVGMVALGRGALFGALWGAHAAAHARRTCPELNAALQVARVMGGRVLKCGAFFGIYQGLAYESFLRRRYTEDVWNHAGAGAVAGLVAAAPGLHTVRVAATTSLIGAAGCAALFGAYRARAMLRARPSSMGSD